MSRGRDLAITSALSSLLGGALAHRLLAVQVDLVRAVDQAVHDRIRQRRVIQVLMPVLDR